MRELVGRLAPLDPEASETLKVVSYFDALVAGAAPVVALVSGAAVLTGTVAGARTSRGEVRVDARGEAPESGSSAGWPVRAAGAAAVWIERTGAPHANDEMVLERLALAVELAEARQVAGPEAALARAIDAGISAADRLQALGRLRLTVDARVRMIATPPAPRASGASVIVATPDGPLSAILDDGAVPLGRPHARAGVGRWVRADHLVDSWADAVLALRLTGDGASGAGDGRIVDATALGVLFDAVRALADSEFVPPDVTALARLDARTFSVAVALAEHDSVRAAAASIGLHHSTLQARHEAITGELGFDPREASGRARFELARLLLRVGTRAR